MTEQLQLKRIIEGALLAAGEPLSVERLSMLFDEAGKPDNATIRATLREMVAEYEGRGFELKEVASGWRFQVCQDLSPWVGRLWEEKPARYSRAMLETLALIAYRQPATRGEIEEIRGVSVSSNIIRTLVEREWIRVVGHRDVPGKPAMFATTKNFLDYFNLRNLGELPTLAEIKDLDKVNAELEFGDEEAAPTDAVDSGHMEDLQMEDTQLENTEPDAEAGEKQQESSLQADDALAGEFIDDLAGSDATGEPALSEADPELH